MATKKTWLGFAAIGAACAGVMARLRKQRQTTPSGGDAEAVSAPMDAAEPMAEAGDKA